MKDYFGDDSSQATKCICIENQTHNDQDETTYEIKPMAVTESLTNYNQ